MEISKVITEKVTIKTDGGKEFDEAMEYISNGYYRVIVAIPLVDGRSNRYNGKYVIIADREVKEEAKEN